MTDEPHEVAVLALPGVVSLDLGVPAQVLGAARDRDGRRFYRVRTCTSDGGPVRSDGFTVLPDHGPELLDRADTVIVPGVHDGPTLRSGALPDGVTTALARAATHARMVSICTGAFALGAAGLLDGRPATTHWAWVEEFRALFPAVRLDPHVLFVDDGDVLTSAGVAAGIDLCLHLVRRDHGREVANRAARRCVVAPWRDGGQAQFIERPLAASEDSSTAPTRAWALERLDTPLDLRALAAHGRMSVRTFTRRFRAETGTSPTRWLITQRVEHACRLLETTDLPVDHVAARSGFGTATAMRQHMRDGMGVGPGAYRRAFRPAPAA